MSTLEGRRSIPDVLIWVHVETYLNDFSSLAQVKIEVKIQFQVFLKKNQIFGLPCVVVFVKTFPFMYQLLM